MSDELRAAAERWRRRRNPPNWSCDHDNFVWADRIDKWRDISLLADAMAAELDPTPVDEVWLRSVGFGPIWAVNKMIGIVAKIDGDEWALGTADDWPFDLYFDPHGRCIRTRIPSQPKTRGDVRRLAAALGVPLKEPKEPPNA